MSEEKAKLKDMKKQRSISKVELAQIDQLWFNQKWLIDQMDKIHAILCPKQRGGWVKRVEQVVAAAEKLKQR